MAIHCIINDKKLCGTRWVSSTIVQCEKLFCETLKEYPNMCCTRCVKKLKTLRRHSMKAIAIIDVQKDFMDRDGALAVPGADAIRPTLAQIAQFARDNNILLFFTQDEHDGTEPEMAHFPLHCMKGTEGQQNIDEVKTEDKDIVFRKRCYDVFAPKLGNPDIEKWLKDNIIDKVYIAGVVGNICCEAAAIGMAKRGIDVTIWDDAVVFMDIDENNTTKSWEKMHAAGVGFGLFQTMKDMIV